MRRWGEAYGRGAKKQRQCEEGGRTGLGGRKLAGRLVRCSFAGQLLGGRGCCVQVRAGGRHTGDEGKLGGQAGGGRAGGTAPAGATVQLEGCVCEGEMGCRGRRAVLGS